VSDDGLLRRAEAAHAVLQRDSSVDPYELLALVLWPPESLARASATDTPLRYWSTEERERVHELHAQGLSQYAIAARLKGPRSSVAEVLRRDGH
jgi:DNA-binding NarL/FixJ family response regulator